MAQAAFYFDSNLCTGCAACAIACQIENQRLPEAGKAKVQPWRTIYSYNATHAPGLPAFHLSLACNHCLEPACLAACPAKAYTKDDQTGAVLINEKYCIGCGYCAWACPFEAPKYNVSLGVMEKCTFCQPRLARSEQPACTSACPTSALHIGPLDAKVIADEFIAREPTGFAGGEVTIATGLVTAGMPGLPRTTIKPAVRFIPLRGLNSLPDKPPVPPNTAMRKIAKISLRSEWPLWFFSSTFPLLFAWFAAVPAWRHATQPWIDAGFLALGGVALVASTLHLGKPLRAWRALLNPNTSWLSREILLVSAFLSFALGAFGLLRLGAVNDFLFRSALLVQASLLAIGLLALYAIDRVYDVVRFKNSPVEEMYRPRLRPHSAWTLLGGLYLAGITALSSGNLDVALLQLILAIVGLLSGASQLCLYANRHSPSEANTPRQALLRSSRVILGFGLPFVLLATDAPLWLTLANAWLGLAIDRAEFYGELEIVTPGW